MAAIIGTDVNDEEALRRQREAEEEAARQAQQAQQEAAEQTQRAQEEAKAAEEQAQEAANEAARQAQEASQAETDAASQQAELDAQFKADTDAAWEDTKKIPGKTHYYTYEDQLAYESGQETGPLPLEKGYTDYSIDMRSVKTREQAARAAVSLKDDEERVRFLSDWGRANGVKPDEMVAYAEYDIYNSYGRNLFSKPYGNGAKIRTANGVISSAGLMGIDGSAIDVTTATPQQVIQAARMEPDPGKQAQIYNAVSVLTNTKGSAWYGMSVSKEDLAFLDSADLTLADYKKEVSAYEEAFSLSDGYTDDNARAYGELVLDVQSAYENPRVQKQMLDKLASVYEERTGCAAPNPDEVATAYAQMRQAEQDEKTGGLFGSIKQLGEDIASGAKDLYYSIFDKEKKADAAEDAEGRSPEEILAEIEEQENAAKGGASSGSSVVSSGAGAAPAVSSGEVQGPQPQNQEMPAPSADSGMEVQGPAPREKDGNTEPIPGNAMAYNPDMTDEEALEHYMNGELLNSRNYDQIKGLIEDPDARGLLYGVSRKENDGDIQSLSDEVLSGVDPMTLYKKYGKTLGKAAYTLQNGSFDKSMQASGGLALYKVMSEINGLVSNPNSGISVPAGQNQYEYVLSQRPDLLESVNSVSSAQGGIVEATTQNALSAHEEKQQRIEASMASILAGNGTADDLAIVAANNDGGDWDDLYDDEMLRDFRVQMGGRSDFYGDNGTFWESDHPAALEGRNLKNMGFGFMDFSNALRDETLKVADSYAMAAHGLGMDLKEYLGSAGITGISDLVDIAYNRMQAEGNDLIDDQEAQEALDTLTGANSVGYLGALGYGGRTGVENWGAGFFQAVGIAMDESTYRETVYDLTNDYFEKYGPLAPYMYRADLEDYKNSGALSEEAAAELDRRMAEVGSIFDVGYEIDPGFLKGLNRTAYNALQKDVESLESLAATLPKDEQTIFGIASNLSYNLTAMGVSALTGHAIGSAVAGTIVGFGANSFSDNWDKYRASGLSRGMSGRMAFLQAAGTVMVNSGGTENQMNNLFSDSGYIGMKALYESEGYKGLVKGMAKNLNKLGMEEAKEEAQETLLEFGIDLFGKEAEALDRGEKPSASRTMKNFFTSLGEANLPELAKETAVSAAGGYAYGMLFGLVGTAKTAGSITSGQKMLGKYESIRTANDMASGKIAITEESIDKALESLSKDLQDPKFCRWIDKVNAAAQEQNATMTAMLTGAGSETRAMAVELAQRATDYEEKAKAARSASDTAKGRWIELRQQASGGDTSVIPAMESARMQWQRAETTWQETSNAAQKTREKAAQKTSEWLRACMEKGGVIKSEMMQQRAAQVKSSLLELAKTASSRYDEMADVQMNSETEDAGVEIGEAVNPSDMKRRQIVDSLIQPVAPDSVPVAENMQKVADMQPVSVLKGNEFQIGGTTLKDDVSAFFAERGNVAKNPVLGDVQLTRKGIKDSIGHKMNPRKAISFAAIPSVIENGEIVDAQKNWKNRGWDTFVIAAPIEIEEGNDAGDYICGVIVKRASGTQRYYVHDVILDSDAEDVSVQKKEAASTPTKPGTQTMPGETSGSAEQPSFYNILENVRDVKRNKRSSSGNIDAKVEAAQRSQAGIDAMAELNAPEQTAQKQTEKSKKLEGSALKAMQNLAKDMGVGLRVRSGQRFQSNGARLSQDVKGYYINGNRNAIVRAVEAGRVRVTGHEIGHAVQEQLGMAASDQMIDRWKSTFGSVESYTPEQYGHEAFAEFFWRYLTSRDRAVDYAGDAYVDAFEQELRCSWFGSVRRFRTGSSSFPLRCLMACTMR